MMSQKLTASELSRIQVLEIVGRIDNTNSPRLVDAVDKALKGGHDYLVLDLAGVDYMNSAGLRELVRILDQVNRVGGSLYITNPSERVNKLLELVGLDSVIEIHTNNSLGLDFPANGNRPTIARNVYYYA